VLVLSVVAVLAVYAGLDADLEEKRKLRDEQVMIDYPEIITKLTMLLSSGMTIRGAFTRISKDYAKKGTKRYAYDEIQRTVNELEVGVSETAAYQNFGRRMRLLAYSRMVTIIVQNLQKGSKSIIPLLSLEASQSLMERRENAKRRAAAAGSKLLIPTGGMLLVVLIIIMVPAFSNM
jgi:pilus assembly protein TadC